MHKHTSTEIITPEEDAVQRKIALIEQRLPQVKALEECCRLCPRNCEVNRIAGEVGTCRIGSEPSYSSANLHFGEEPPISGFAGSGTIFMTGCNLNCKFCQNFPISQLRHGNNCTIEELAGKMLRLQAQGAHNINFVTPTHQAAAIFKSLLIAYNDGLHIPLVYNSGGYESLEMLNLWDGIIDIYMPDSKYGDDNVAMDCSNAPLYIKHNRVALKEMHRQVGILQISADGLAQRGLLIRHLVLPGGLAGSREVLKFIAEEISPDTYLSVMSQYFPAHKAIGDRKLDRRISKREFKNVVDMLDEFNLQNGWVQPL